jgi:xeroderma pigmentosum group C-complementing protein
VLFLLRPADTVAQAYWETEHVAAQKEQEKRRLAILKRWTKLVHGLRIRQRMREQYGTATASGLDSSRKDDEGGGQDEGPGGGFLTGVGDVVQPYSLPRPTHVVFASPPRSPEPDARTPGPALALPLLDDDAAESDDVGDAGLRDWDLDMRSGGRPANKSEGNGENRGMPKSMAQLAAEAEAAATTAQMIKVVQGDEVMEEGQEGAASVAPPRRRAPPRARSKAKGEAREERPRGRKRPRESEGEGEWVGGAQPGGGVIEEDAVGKDGRLQDAKRARPRARGSALAVPVPTSDRVLRARKH